VIRGSALSSPVDVTSLALTTKIRRLEDTKKTIEVFLS